MKRLAVVLTAAFMLAGCVSTLSEDRIRTETAGAIGVSPDAVTISNVRHEMTNTYYTARTRNGDEYACILNGGNLMTFGMTNPAICNKKAR